jgi:hypothetical protein
VRASCGIALKSVACTNSITYPKAAICGGAGIETYGIPGNAPDDSGYGAPMPTSLPRSGHAPVAS